MPAPGPAPQKKPAPPASSIFSMPGVPTPFGIIDPRTLLDISMFFNQEATRPQKPNEPNYVYDLRKTFTYPIRKAQGAGDVVGRYVDDALSTPNSRAAAAGQNRPAVSPRSVFPESFNDAAYDEAEANAARITGVPQDLLRAIRLRGERSNASAVSSAGARTPYQIIPGTAAGIKRNYGIDPLSSPTNAALGAAYVLREQAGSSAKDPNQPNWADPMIRLRAVGGYIGGAPGAANPLSEDLRDANMSVGQYARNVLGENLVSGFSPQYMNQALGAVEQSRQQSLQPFRTDFQTTPMPELPKPEPTPKMDFAASDAALQAMRPVEFSLKEQENLKWKNFWGSIGQAMMRSPEGEGLGSFFMRIGGAALAGSGMTRDEIQQRKDLYDTQMSKWQAALYESDFQKAQIQQNELMRDWQANQNWALNKYQQGMEIWSKTAMPTVSGNNLYFQSIDPATGKGSVVVQPISTLVNAAAAMDKANIYSQAFGVQNSANAQVAGVANRVQGQIVMAQAGQVLADQTASPQEKAAAAAFGPLSAINYAIDTGQIASVIGPDLAESLNEEVMNTLAQQGMFPGQKGYDEAHRQAATGRLLAYTMQSPETLQKLMATMGPASGLYNAYERYQGRTERSITNNKGQTSYQVTTEEPQ